MGKLAAPQQSEKKCIKLNIKIGFLKKNETYYLFAYGWRKEDARPSINKIGR